MPSVHSINCTLVVMYHDTKSSHRKFSSSLGARPTNMHGLHSQLVVGDKLPRLVLTYSTVNNFLYLKTSLGNFQVFLHIYTNNNLFTKYCVYLNKC